MCHNLKKNSKSCTYNIGHTAHFILNYRLSFYSSGSEYIIILAEFNFFLRFKNLPKDTEHVSESSDESPVCAPCLSFPTFLFPSLLLSVLVSFLFCFTSPLSPPPCHSCFLFSPFLSFVSFLSILIFIFTSFLSILFWFFHVTHFSSFLSLSVCG